MKVLFIGSRLYDDIDWYVKSKGVESVLTESNEEAVNLDLPDQVFIVPRGMEGPKQVALMQNVDAIVPLIGIDPPLLDVAHMKEEVESEYGIPVIAAGVRAVEITSDKSKTKEFFTQIGVNTSPYQILNSPDELELEFPVVLKQCVGQGGKDIRIARSMDDVREYFNDFDMALCEKFIQGQEISIEVLGFNGEYVALPPVCKSETSLEGTHPLNKIKTAPCLVQGLDNNYTQYVASKIARNLNSDGIFEFDFIFSAEDNMLYALEVNTRPNGTRYLTNATSGINTLYELVNMAIGEFSLENVSRKLQYHYATEIPVGDYGGPLPNEPLKSFEHNDFIIHGPKGFQRITIRADSQSELENRINELI